jgi:hypothetical protein
MFPDTYYITTDFAHVLHKEEIYLVIAIYQT